MKFKLQSFLLSILVLLVILLGTILYQAFDSNNMQSLFLKHGNFSQTPVNEEWASKIAESVTRYLSGMEKYMQLDYIGDNGREFLFTQKELSHMEDVRKLILIAQSLFLFSFIFSIILIFKMKAFSIKYYIIGILCVVLVSMVLFIFINNNFDKAFIIMHKLLFTNDNWLLTPGEDVIISLMPTSYFIYVFNTIITQFIILFITINVVLLVYINKIKKI